MVINASDFVHGATNKVSFVEEEAGGKAINVALQLKNLGHDPKCLGFNFSTGGEKLDNKLSDAEISHDFEYVPGRLRVNTKLYDTATKTMTELNQLGDFVPAVYETGLRRRINRANFKGGLLVLSGSLPPGISMDIYKNLALGWDGPVMLDATGEPLRAAIEGAGLYAIKPNVHELSETFNANLSTPEDIASFCRKKLNHIPLICVSMGDKGAVLVTKTAAYHAPARKVETKSLHGAGDAMLSGLIHGLITDQPTPELLRYGAAAATARVQTGKWSNLENFNLVLDKIPAPYII